MMHFMNLNNRPFISISKGIKTIEMRLNDERRQSIKAGDVIEFLNNKTQEKLRVLVIKKHYFLDFFELYQAFDKTLLGYNENEVAQPQDMEAYYPLEKIKQYGVLALEIKLLSEVTPKILVDHGICPTCFDKEHDQIIYGDNREKTIYEDDDFICLLVNKPRKDGHAIISTKTHYKDMLEIPDEICTKAFLLSKKIMHALQKVYKCESVYLCTMCDGPMNHFHLQLIPRHAYEERGSLNFVKKRSEYIHNPINISLLRDLIK